MEYSVQQPVPSSTHFTRPKHTHTQHTMLQLIPLRRQLATKLATRQQQQRCGAQGRQGRLLLHPALQAVAIDSKTTSLPPSPPTTSITAPSYSRRFHHLQQARRHHHRHQRREYNYNTFPGGQEYNTPPPPPPQRPRPPFSALALLGLGVLLAAPGYLALHYSDILARATSTTPEKQEQAARRIRARAAALPLVQALLADPDWAAHHHDAYAAFAHDNDNDDGGDNNNKRLTTGPLGTAKALGSYQHVFHNAATGEVLTVVYLGTFLVGYPFTAHGGVLATLLDEQCARAALQDVAFADGGGGGGGIVTARLEIDYRRPTTVQQFCVVKARAVPEEELEAYERGKRGRKVWVRTTLETVDGKVCVEGRALFVKPAGVELRPVGEDF